MRLLSLHTEFPVTVIQTLYTLAVEMLTKSAQSPYGADLLLLLTMYYHGYLINFAAFSSLLTPYSVRVYSFINS